MVRYGRCSGTVKASLRTRTGHVRAEVAALQIAWSQEAQGAVNAFLTEEDDYLRRMAVHLVQCHFSAQRQLRVLASLSKEPQDPHISVLP